MKNFFLLVLFVSILLLISSRNIVYADSNYVLPYPSAMPGSNFYKIRLLYEKIEQYWYFGSFGQFKYHLKLSDKYLVEAKTLFEYKQYLLAYNSLRKSNGYFKYINIYLSKAKEENKNIEQKQNILNEASLKHIETLNIIQRQTPKKFTWQPERGSSTPLDIQDLMEESISLRQKNL